MTPIDLRLLDELCIQMQQYADTIEKLLATNKRLSSDVVCGMTEIVFETRRQLTELIGSKNKDRLGEFRILTIGRLLARYDSLEGSLKEARNDLKQRALLLSNIKRC